MSGTFCLTASGRIIDFADLDRSQIEVEDIATGLAAAPRWAGQTRWIDQGLPNPYTVAQHSVHVADVVRALGGSLLEQYCGLHHDDFEANGCDVPTPLKRMCSGYTATEKRCLAAIFEALGLPPQWANELPAVVRRADAVMLATEARDLCHPKMAAYVDTSTAQLTPLVVMPPVRAYWAYLLRHQQLTVALGLPS